MRIGVVGTIWLNTPPKNYGGTEGVLFNLVEGLVKKGHDVTYFGPATSTVSAKLIPTTSRPLREKDVSWRNVTYTLFHLTEVFDRAKDFDIIHVHLNKAQDYISLPFSVYKNTPTLFTLHFNIPTENYNPDRFLVLQKYRHLPYSSISKSQQKSYLTFIANVYNGISLSQYPFVKKPQDYFVWLGKITPFKGTREAILAAKKAGKKLYLLGVIERGVKEHMDYYEEEIKPLIDNEQIVFYRNVGLPQKAELLGNAQALLNPIQWEEPFGLVMIESQATGTPVIAFNRGAASEVVKQEETGYLVHSVDEMVRAMKKIDRIKRADCRAFIEQQFTIEKMVEGYVQAYEKVIANWNTYYKNQVDSFEK